jgi:hypothetical protein
MWLRRLESLGLIPDPVLVAVETVWVRLVHFHEDRADETQRHAK